MLTWQLALRNIFRHRTRSIISLSSIAFGSVAIIFANGFFEDIFKKLKESSIHGLTGHMQIYQRGFFDRTAKDENSYLIQNPVEVAQAVEKLPAVKWASPRLFLAGLLSTGEHSVSCLAIGVEPEKSSIMKMDEALRARETQDIPEQGMILQDGTQLSDHNPHAVVMGVGLAESLSSKVGDELIFLTRTVDDSINGQDISVAGLYYSGSKEVDDFTLRLPLPTAQQLLRSSSVQSIMVLLKNTEDTLAVKNMLTDAFARNNWDLEIKLWNEINDFYVGTKAMFDRWFMVLKVIIAIIVVLSVYNTLNMSLFERTVEIGTLMALGSTKTDVIRLILVEGFILGSLGGLLGAGVGAMLTGAIAHIGIVMPPPPGFSTSWICEPIVLPQTLFSTIGLSVFVSLISSLAPSLRASQMEIAQALRFTA